MYYMKLQAEEVSHLSVIRLVVRRQPIVRYSLELDRLREELAVLVLALFDGVFDGRRRGS